MRVGSRETSIFCYKCLWIAGKTFSRCIHQFIILKNSNNTAEKKWSAGRLEREKLTNQELALWIQHCWWESTSEHRDLNTCHYRCGQAEHPGMVQQTPCGLEETALQMCFLPSPFFRQLSIPMYYHNSTNIYWAPMALVFCGCYNKLPQI